jgi:DNA-binding NtrC family response regulator
VILDMIMPDMEGGEVFESLKRMNSQIKVLLSSGYSINGRAREILKRGCVGFLQKPFTLAELSQKVKDALAKHWVSPSNLERIGERKGRPSRYGPLWQEMGLNGAM